MKDAYSRRRFENGYVGEADNQLRNPVPDRLDALRSFRACARIIADKDKSPLRVRILTLAFIFSLVVLSLTVPVMAQTTIEEPSPIKKAIAVNEPAVVLIYETYDGTFSVLSATYQIDNQGMFHFFQGAKLLTQQVQSASFGSGFIITPDGYIITNAHVATSQAAKIEFLLNIVSSELQYQLQQGAFSNQLSQNFEYGYFDYLQSAGKFSNEQNTVVAFLPVVSATGNLTAKSLSADVKVAGDMTGTGTERDVAIIKIVADHALPTVQLGDSDGVSPGDSIVIIGYPGISASTQNIAGIESFIPTATAGIVSALKPMPQGWKVIQTDATIHHGNSGGPAFDAGGNVIGIATFLGVNPQPGSSGELSGINFLVPVNIAKQFTDQISVRNTRGVLDQDWQQGLEYFWGHHYSAAVQEFNTVLDLYPGDPYAAQYLQQANSEIAKGNDLALSSTSSNPQITGTTFEWTLLVAVAILVPVTWFVAKRKPKKRAMSVPLGSRARFCRRCGTTIHRQTNFCTKCGATLTLRRSDVI